MASSAYYFDSPPPPYRYTNAQKNHTIIHPTLPQPPRGGVDNKSKGDDDDEAGAAGDDSSQQSAPAPESSYSFVVCADTQLGMSSNNKDWTEEMRYSRDAVDYINNMNPPPLFCCVCGDLVHMEALIYAGQSESWKKDQTDDVYTVEQCYEIQDEQNRDFQSVWNNLRQDVALVCVCGNHDVGNRPTRTSIERFRRAFGDDRLAFWAATTTTPPHNNKSYHVIVNTSLFNDPSGAMDIYQEQLDWMKERFQYAVDNEATHIFVFGHHPWFLYHEDENEKSSDEMPGGSTIVGVENSPIVERDSYFCIPRERRRQVLKMFDDYNVTAAFAGHFHQNLISTTSFGMEMITTSALSVVLQSNGIPRDFKKSNKEPKTRGLRRVNVKAQQGKFDHEFISI